MSVTLEPPSLLDFATKDTERIGRKLEKTVWHKGQICTKRIPYRAQTRDDFKKNYVEAETSLREQIAEMRKTMVVIVRDIEVHSCHFDSAFEPHFQIVVKTLAARKDVVLDEMAETEEKKPDANPTTTA